LISLDTSNNTKNRVLKFTNNEHVSQMVVSDRGDVYFVDSVNPGIIKLSKIEKGFAEPVVFKVEE
jgi:hypothetical protein